MELIVILIIISVVAAFLFPNFTVPAEQARALTARNNLLAIYTAQQNYINNNNTITYCYSGGTGCGSLPAINTTLSLNIQDDGTYTYQCLTSTTCVATRTNPASAVTITVHMDSAIDISGGTNPRCIALTGAYTNWCNY